MPHIKAKSDVHWHYDVEGEGEVLLFLHGWGVDKKIWRQQSKFFSQYFKVITIDLPGHGKSTWQKIPLEDMAHDLRRILHRLGVYKFIVVGSSLGGLLALKYYSLYPQDITKMIFVGSLPKFAKSKGHPYGLDVAQIRKLSGQIGTAYPNVVNIFFRSLFTKEERESRRFKWLMKFRNTDDDQAPMQPALIEYLDILENEDLREELKKVTIPVQFINGRGDEICHTVAVNYVKTLLPQARYDFFDDCGHFPFLSKPHEFNQVLGDFIFGEKRRVDLQGNEGPVFNA